MVKQNPMKPVVGERRIAYCQPTSPGACRHNRGDTGCYVFETHSAEIPLNTFAEAVEQARALQTTPQRWSMDHPLNLHFLSASERQFLAANPAASTAA